MVKDKRYRKWSMDTYFPHWRSLHLRSGRATYTDKLFKFRNGRFEDLLNDDINEHRDVANRMAGRSVACVDRKVNTHTRNYIRVSSADMRGCRCLFTSYNSRPACAALLSLCSDTSFGDNVGPFSSLCPSPSSVITEAGARLFYRTSYEGMSDDCSLPSIIFSIFPFRPFFISFPPLLLSLTDSFFVSYHTLTSNLGIKKLIVRRGQLGSQ